MSSFDLIVEKTDKLSGVVEAPPSKAYTHRAIIAASLSEGRSSIKNMLICDDTLVTVRACSMLGAAIREIEKGLVIDGVTKPIIPEDVIHCGESGSTIRFITPICALADGISVLTGGKSLRKRPMKPLLEALKQLGVRCYSTRNNGCPPILVFGGGIKRNRTSIRGDVSSQFISGLLFAASKSLSNTEIEVTTRLESKPYVTMTLEVLRNHGIRIDYESDYSRFLLPGRQDYMPFDYYVEGDYSSAAFLLAAASITDSSVKVENLLEKTNQGDRVILRILKDMGVQLKLGEGNVEVQGAEKGLRGIDVDVRDTPDLAPICMVLACFAKGETVIEGVRRLRFKESDRIASMISELKKMGGKVSVSENRIYIEGSGSLHAAEIDPHNDHRIAMACAVAALGAEGRTVIHGIECVKKSYPNFVKDLCSIGGAVGIR